MESLFLQISSKKKKKAINVINKYISNKNKRHNIFIK